MRVRNGAERNRKARRKKRMPLRSNSCGVAIEKERRSTVESISVIQSDVDFRSAMCQWSLIGEDWREQRTCFESECRLWPIMYKVGYALADRKEVDCMKG